MRCPECKGTGNRAGFTRADDDCGMCNGSGQIDQNEHVCNLFLAHCEARASQPGPHAEFWRRLAGSVRKAASMS